MRMMKVVNESRQTVLGWRIRLADSLPSRLRGFLFRARPAMGEGLFLAPCKGVHMFGMRFPLDVLIINQTGMVMAAHPALEPGQRTPVYREAQYALELPAGAIEATATSVGDRLSWQPVAAAEVREPPRAARSPQPQAPQRVRSAGGAKG